MGQKVNPLGVRLGFNQKWYSQWFSQHDYARYLQQDFLIKDVIRKRFARSGISTIEILRNRADLVVVIHTAKPGIIIGRSGVGAQELKLKLEKLIMMHPVSKEKPTLRISIMEEKNSELSAPVIAETIAGQLERRIAVKRAMRQAVERAVEKKAKGIKIRISGRLGGVEIARSEVISSGSIPLQTIRSSISYALAEAHTTFGIVGIKVWVYNGESDTIDLDAPIEATSRQRTPSYAKS